MIKELVAGLCDHFGIYILGNLGTPKVAKIEERRSHGRHLGARRQLWAPVEGHWVLKGSSEVISGHFW